MDDVRMWGIHMREEASPNAVDQNYVAIGWHEAGDIFSVEKSRQSYKDLLEETYPKIKKGAVPVHAGTLYKFVHEVKKGDFVVLPSKHDRMVNIGQFTGEYFRASNTNEPYPNCRQVNWLGHFPRSDFSQSALYEIGSAITLFTVRSHKNEFLSKVSPNLSNSEIGDEDVDDLPDDESVATQVSRQAEETTQDFVIKKISTGLSGYDFEDFVAHLLDCMGYTTRVTSGSGDGGVDVIAHMDELGFQPPIIKVQCKRTTGQTGEPDVNQLLGTLGEGEYALFINLGSYSRPARLLERNRAKLRLIDGEQLVDLIMEHYGAMSARYRTLIPLRQIYVPDLLD